MKIDHEYLKGLLVAFEDSPEPTTDIQALADAGFNYEDPRFGFHMALLDDMRLIERDDGDPGIGRVSGIDGFSSWSALPLRLTANGHEFLEVLRNQEIWSTIQRDFKEASLDTMYRVGRGLLSRFIQKKLDDFVDY